MISSSTRCIQTQCLIVDQFSQGFSFSFFTQHDVRNESHTPEDSRLKDVNTTMMLMMLGVFLTHGHQSCCWFVQHSTLQTAIPLIVYDVMYKTVSYLLSSSSPGFVFPVIFRDLQGESRSFLQTPSRALYCQARHLIQDVFYGWRYRTQLTRE